jgi:hypothetical protein
MNVKRTPFLDSLATAAGFNLDNAAEARCIKCGEPFSNKNTHTAAGWKETAITGLCEDCFDRIFEA